MKPLDSFTLCPTRGLSTDNKENEASSLPSFLQEKGGRSGFKPVPHHPSNGTMRAMIRASPFEPVVHERNFPKSGTISPLNSQEYLAWKSGTGDREKELPNRYRHHVSTPQSKERREANVADTIRSTRRLPESSWPSEDNNDSWKTRFLKSEVTRMQTSRHMTALVEENRRLRIKMISLQAALYQERLKNRNASEKSKSSTSRKRKEASCGENRHDISMRACADPVTSVQREETTAQQKKTYASPENQKTSAEKEISPSATEVSLCNGNPLKSTEKAGGESCTSGLKEGSVCCYKESATSSPLNQKDSDISGKDAMKVATAQEASSEMEISMPESEEAPVATATSPEIEASVPESEKALASEDKFSDETIKPSESEGAEVELEAAILEIEQASVPEDKSRRQETESEDSPARETSNLDNEHVSAYEDTSPERPAEVPESETRSLTLQTEIPVGEHVAATKGKPPKQESQASPSFESAEEVILTELLPRHGSNHINSRRGGRIAMTSPDGESVFDSNSSSDSPMLLPPVRVTRSRAKRTIDCVMAADASFDVFKASQNLDAGSSSIKNEERRTSKRVTRSRAKHTEKRGTKKDSPPTDNSVLNISTLSVGRIENSMLCLSPIEKAQEENEVSAESPHFSTNISLLSAEVEFEAEKNVPRAELSSGEKGTMTEKDTSILKSRTTQDKKPEECQKEKKRETNRNLYDNFQAPPLKKNKKRRRR